ncbi:MAG: Holliday junction resolvase RuvX [Clostridia bacterium]|nr:Holliday junction resolvase RuvX [Clostridia bacterium]
MKTAAIDLGDVRTGLAFSDGLGVIAGRALTLTARSREELISKLLSEIAAEGASLIVVGLPLNMDGTEGPRAEKARAFAELLKKETAVPVVLWDERSTSVTANRILSDAGKKKKKQRALVDAVAASVILQSYLDANK